MARPLEFDTREALDRVMGVFWRKGYEATSLVDLLNATGLSRSSLYGAFGGKRALFLAGFDHYRQDRAREMEATLAHGPGRTAIEAFFLKIVSAAEANGVSHGCMMINQAIELAPQDPEIRARVQADLQGIEDALARAVERGRRDGSILSRRDARELGRLLALLFPAVQVMARAGGDRSGLQDTLKLALSVLD